MATIIKVKAHKADGSSPKPARYDISLKVADAIYTALYTDAFAPGVERYAGGQELLVHVGTNTITYNDILGRSQEVPIIRWKPATSTKQSK